VRRRLEALEQQETVARESDCSASVRPTTAERKLVAQHATSWRLSGVGELVFVLRARQTAVALGGDVNVHDREKQIGGSRGSLKPSWASLLNPLGLVLCTSIPFIWRVLSAFLPA
jgi:hypothetical protein